mgnify:CR=1 FL=1
MKKIIFVFLLVPFFYSRILACGPLAPLTNVTGSVATRLDEVNIVRITDKNKFNNMPNGIWCYDNPQADILIDDNDINVDVNPPNLGNGIIVQEIFLFQPPRAHGAVIPRGQDCERRSGRGGVSTRCQDAFCARLSDRLRASVRF